MKIMMMTKIFCADRVVSLVLLEKGMIIHSVV